MRRLLIEVAWAAKDAPLEDRREWLLDILDTAFISPLPTTVIAWVLSLFLRPDVVNRNHQRVTSLWMASVYFCVCCVQSNAAFVFAHTSAGNSSGSASHKRLEYCVSSVAFESDMCCRGPSNDRPERPLTRGVDFHSRCCDTEIDVTVGERGGFLDNWK